MTGRKLPAKYFRSIVDEISGGIYIVDQDKIIVFWSHGAERLTGFAPDEMIGKSCGFFSCEFMDYDGNHPCEGRCPFNHINRGNERRKGDEIYLLHKSGHRIPVILRSIPLIDDEGNTIAVGEYFYDNSILLMALERIEKYHTESTIDKLTGIYNRRYCDKYLELMVTRAEMGDEGFSIIFADIDNFKGVNDEYGHEIGDEVLITVVKSLKASLREGDLLFRWGGEEFLIILNGISSDDLQQVAERCRMLVENSAANTDKGKIAVTISLGATTYIQGEKILKTIDRADELLYKSKESGKNTVTAG